MRDIPGYYTKRPDVIRSFAAGEAGWHVLLLFYSNASFAFDFITSLLRLHLQEPSPKRDLPEGPKALTQVSAGAHQQLLSELVGATMPNLPIEDLQP